MTSSDILEKVRRHIRILVDIGRIAGDEAELDNFLDQVVIQVSRAVEIDHVKVLCYRPQTADLLITAGIGWKKGVVRSATLSADMRSAPGRAFQTAEPVILTDFDKQSEFVISRLLKDHGIVSLANVPVKIGGAAWGVLEVDSTTPRDFSEDTIGFLTAAAAMIGAFLQHRLNEPSATELAVEVMKATSSDVLLREMRHRVKNNFQLILASISIQKRRYSNAEAHRALDHVASRINAISLAHDQLAPQQDGRVVHLSDYVRAICSSIMQQVDGVEIEVASDEVALSIDRAVPIGLIINEVATNSIKHAFSPGGGGKISVKLEGGVGYGEALLTVSDNGHGIKHETSSSGGSGLKLVASLARQIGAPSNRKVRNKVQRLRCCSLSSSKAQTTRR